VVTIVADTNVYVSGFNFGGAPLEVLLLAVRRQIDLVISPSILKEIEGILVRKFQWSAERTREALAIIRRFARSVVPTGTIDHLKEDEADNRILECAVEAKAHVVVTGDRHLKTLRIFRGIAVMNPREFLDAHTAGVFNAL